MHINCFDDKTTFFSYHIAHTVFEGFKELMGLPANKTPKRAEHDEIWAFFSQTHEKTENHQNHLKRPEKIFKKALYNFFLAPIFQNLFYHKLQILRNININEQSHFLRVAKG